MEHTMVIPCDVAVKRFYRVYLKIEAAPDQDGCFALPDNKAIEEMARDQIVQEQDGAMMLDPDLEIEEHDICWVDPDKDGWWTEAK